jgi:N-acetylglucosamine kinase-like BadF-type ATPase
MNPIAVGIDAGGTKTLVRWRGPGSKTHDILLEGANVQRIGVDEAARVLAEAIQRVATRTQNQRLHVVAGVAGAGRSVDQHLLRDATQALLPSRLHVDLRVTHDADIALTGAHGDGAGGLLLAGTGSIALMRDAEGAIHRAGGWGYLLGDEASGTRLGLAALQIALHTLDGGRPSLLVDMLHEQYDMDRSETIVRRVYREKWPVQKAAPLLLRAVEMGDVPSREALELQTRFLARQAQLAAQRARLEAPTIALAGGLCESAVYRSVLGDAVETVLPGCTLRLPEAPPAEGALLQAEQALS